MLTPKAKFLTLKDLVNRHLDTVMSESFQRASDTALLQFLLESPTTTDPVVAAANYHRIIGARDFLEKLHKIAEVSEPLKPIETSRLNHQTQTQSYATRT